jgi:hypothetical protein
MLDMNDGGAYIGEQKAGAALRGRNHQEVCDGDATGPAWRHWLRERLMARHSP